VAIKSLRGDKRSPEEELQLLREAWLTAELEHPNVVPVHDVLFDPVEGPIIVLKRVQGMTWSDLLDDADAVRERFHGDDLLVFHIEILMQLCRAVHYAHSHGVVHRDIKPANVMIGDYGEVYLVDWGIAVSLGDDPTGRLPLAQESGGLAGTPAYMAPEMLDPEPGRVDARTDVYLLGSVLHCIVAGSPPHAHESHDAIVESILRSRPRFGSDVPEALQHIVARAMAPEPADRYPSADELRLELRHFLRTRDSMAMAAVALDRLDELRVALAAGDKAAPEKVFALFGECRFGLQEALRAWSDNERAREAMGELIHRMTEHLLERDDAGGARALLADHPNPDPALAARVEEAVERQRFAREELTRLQRELDPGIGRPARRAAMVAMGVLWTFAPLLAEIVDPSAAPAVVSYLMPAGLLALALVVWYAARESLAKTAINRRFLIAMLVGFCAHMVHVLLVQLAVLPAKAELAMGMVSFGAIAAVLAYTAERRLWPLVPLYWGGALLAGGFREQSPYVLSACNLALTIYMLAIWSPLKTPAEAPPRSST
jgi:serine/threonine-protein kinase